MLRTSWLWLAVAGFISWLQLSWFGGVIATVKHAVPPQMPPRESRALFYLGGLIGLLAAASIAVAWHIGVGILISLVAFLSVFLILLVVTLLVS